MKRIFLFISVFFLIGTSVFAAKSSMDDADAKLKSGDLKGAAVAYIDYYNNNKRDKSSARALAMTGRIMDKLREVVSEEAEKKCYWGKNTPKTPQCMEKEVKEYNKIFGKDALEYIGGTSIAYIDYTGSHYKELLKKFKNNKYSEEAEFYLMLQNLKGHPDEVLPKVKSFLGERKSGEWKKRSLLLWARVNQDVWNVWKEWSWVVFNKKISDDEMIVRAEPYRQEALKTFSQIKGNSGFIGKAAKSEYKMLNDQVDDGIHYSITNDSTPGTWANWGLSLTD